MHYRHRSITTPIGTTTEITTNGGHHHSRHFGHRSHDDSDIRHLHDDGREAAHRRGRRSGRLFDHGEVAPCAR